MTLKARAGPSTFGAPGKVYLHLDTVPGINCPCIEPADLSLVEKKKLNLRYGVCLFNHHEGEKSNSHRGLRCRHSQTAGLCPAQGKPIMGWVGGIRGAVARRLESNHKGALLVSLLRGEPQEEPSTADKTTGSTRGSHGRVWRKDK